jgi:hypothetical protein
VLIYVVDDVDVSSGISGEDKFSIPVVVSIIPDCSTSGSTLLLLPTTLTTEDDVKVSVGNLVLYVMAEVVCESAFCMSSDDRVPAVVVWWSALICAFDDVDMISGVSREDKFSIPVVVSISPD